MLVRRDLFLRAAFVALVVSTAGCATTSDKLRSRFAKEHGCPEAESHVVGSGGTTYEASGCGQRTTYVCPSFAGDARSCEEKGVSKRDGADPKPMPGPNAPPEPPR